jgi:CRP/FNR family transcriptional regulator
MPENDFELLRRTSVQLRFEKSETILKQGAKSHHLVFLHKGIVKFSYQYGSGTKYIMTIVGGPKLLGAANLFFKETNIFSLVAMNTCEICLIDSKAMRALALKHSEFILAMCEETMGMFQNSIFNFISMAHNQVNGRIADVLLYLWNDVYHKNPEDFIITRKELAEFAACSHENVITTLSRFNKEGIITLDGKKIIVNDPEKLKQISHKG